MKENVQLMKKSGQHVMRWTAGFLKQRPIGDLESDVGR